MKTKNAQMHDFCNCSVIFSMRVVFLRIVLLLVLSALAFSVLTRAGDHATKHNRLSSAEPDISAFKNVSRKNALDTAKTLLPWLQKNGYSTRLLFLADMNLSMQVKRFYVINPDSMTIMNSFLVAHGSGMGSTHDSVVFSNTPGSLCTSKGKYKLGGTLYGEYGKGYYMDGLESCNSNARKRLIVFHYYTPQTTEEYHERNFFSFGCPMIAQSSFDYCDSLIQREKKPVLMYIYK